MAEHKKAGNILLVVGIIIFTLSPLADFLGFGEPGFGYKQTMGTIAGAIIFVVGLILK